MAVDSLAASAAGGAAATTLLSQAPATSDGSAAHGNTATLPAIGHDPDDEPRKRRGLAYVLLVVAVVGALTLLVLAGKGLLNRPPSASATVAVPAVIDLPVETAQAKIRAVGLVPQETDVASDKEVGRVVDQNPGADEKVAPGSTVTLSVSAGPDTVDVPDLSGYSEDEAKAALANLNLKVGKVTQVDNKPNDKGKIIDTEPAAGQSVPVGTAVALNISSGKAVVPDVVGKTRNDAASELSDLGFRIKTTYVTSTETEDTVLKQSAKAGSKLDYGSTVTLTVAQPAPPTQTPTQTPSTTTTTTGPLPPVTTPPTP
jgi:serine/threonine-protein kinase